MPAGVDHEGLLEELGLEEVLFPLMPGGVDHDGESKDKADIEEVLFPQMPQRR